MRLPKLLVVIVVLLLAVAAGIAASVMHNGMSARATPTALEAYVARHVRALAMPSGSRAMTNPVADTPENLRDARLHFADHCATCHGNNGNGDTMIGRGLYPKPPDLRQEHTQKLSDGEIYWIIENGVRFTGMPGFAGPDSSDDTWKLVRFIRHLPQLTPEELLEMQRYNPKGPEDRSEEKEEDQFLDEGTPPPSAAPSHHHH
jgi:mono/diheme cytochrome c family protein